MSHPTQEMKEEQATKVDSAIEQLEKAFKYHPPKDGQAQRYTFMRDEAKKLAYTFHHQCPPSREKSLAMTKLEEAVMWANAAIARNE